jgi:hypothetical protein
VLAERCAARPLLEALALRLGRADAPVAHLRRDVARHFPHLSEQLAGLAVGAGVPEAFLADELVRALAEVGTAAAALPGETALLARKLVGDTVVRRNRPEGLFASLDLTRPWLPAALLGVNERGLAVVVADSGAPDDGCAAPAALLAQDCLERFEALDAALDWCAGRPTGGRATLLLGDAAGDVAGIAIDGGQCRVLRPADDRLAPAGAGAELAKTLRDAAPGAPPPAELAQADPRQRTLCFAGATYRL